MLSDDEQKWVETKAKINFAIGSILAFLCGVTMVANNFIIKMTGTDFGLLIAITGLLQPVVMLITMAFEG